MAWQISPDTGWEINWIAETGWDLTWRDSSCSVCNRTPSFGNLACSLITILTEMLRGGDFIYTPHDLTLNNKRIWLRLRKLCWITVYTTFDTINYVCILLQQDISNFWTCHHRAKVHFVRETWKGVDKLLFWKGISVFGFSEESWIVVRNINRLILVMKVRSFFCEVGDPLLNI